MCACIESILYLSVIPTNLSLQFMSNSSVLWATKINQGHLCDAEFGGLRRGYIAKDSDFSLPEYQ